MPSGPGFSLRPVNPAGLLTDDTLSRAIEPRLGVASGESAVMTRQKDILTTGEVAEICNVAPRTVSKWFDSGQLRGYRIPGSKDRRIPLSSLIKFMKAHNIPMDGLQSGARRVMIVDNESETIEVLEKMLTEQASYEVKTAHHAFQAGMLCQGFKPHVILLDVHLDNIDGEEVLKVIRENEDLQMTRVIAISNKLSEGQGKHLMKKGFDGYLRKPFHVRQVIEAVEDAASIVH
jgi:excisionase family DNA binding protein